MRAAPPLALALGPGRPESAAVAVLAAASAGTALGWALWHAVAAQALAWWPAVLLLPLSALLAAAVAWARCRPVQGRLAWDGRAWSLEPAGTAVTLQPAIDLGGWMLLRLAPAGGPVRWAGLARRQAGAAHWHALRAILYSARPAAADAGTPA